MYTTATEDCDLDLDFFLHFFPLFFFFCFVFLATALCFISFDCLLLLLHFNAAESGDPNCELLQTRAVYGTG